MKMNSLHRITTIGICTALSVVLIWLIRFPIIPSLNFLEYDPGDIPIYVCTALFGPLYGFLMTVIASVIQGMTVSALSGWIGIIMHIFATGSYVLFLGFLNIKSGRLPLLPRMIVSVTAGTAVMTVIMVIWNLIFTPIFMGTTVDAVIPLLPLIALFNVIKGAVNGAVTVAVYMPLRRIFKNLFNNTASIS